VCCFLCTRVRFLAARSLIESGLALQENSGWRFSAPPPTPSANKLVDGCQGWFQRGVYWVLGCNRAKNCWVCLLCFKPKIDTATPPRSPGLARDISLHPGVLLKDPGVLSKDPGVLSKDPGVL